jgi:acetylornithine deacetylase/succinyl-diaminopimelate desuccinylase-like protein
VDPIVAGAALVTQLQSLVSRSVSPIDSAVLTVGQFHAGTASNIIPQTAMLYGTLRTLRTEVREVMIERLHQMLKGLEGIHTHATSVRLPVLANDQDLPRLAAMARPLLAAAPHGLLIAGHGLYAWGRDLANAHRHLEILEFLLEQRWRQLLLQTLSQHRTLQHEQA